MIGNRRGSDDYLPEGDPMIGNLGHFSGIHLLTRSEYGGGKGGDLRGRNTAQVVDPGRHRVWRFHRERFEEDGAAVSLEDLYLPAGRSLAHWLAYLTPL